LQNTAGEINSGGISSTFFTVIFGVIIFGLAITNPSKTDFKNFINEKISSKVDKELSKDKALGFSKELMSGFVKGISNIAVEGMINRENFFIFSTYEVDTSFFKALNQDVSEMKFLGIANSFIPLSKSVFSKSDNEKSPKTELSQTENFITEPKEEAIKENESRIEDLNLNTKKDLNQEETVVMNSEAEIRNILRYEPSINNVNLNNKYWVQLGSFFEKSLGNDLKNKFSQLFNNVDIYEGKNINDEKVWRVRVGPYNTIEDTNKVTSLLKNRDIKYVIIRPDSGDISTSNSNWITDFKSGCKFYNSSPQPNESIEFDGNCMGGFGNGRGTLTWYNNGKYYQTTKGYWEKGLLQGEAELSFSNGDEIKGNYKNNKRDGRVIVNFGDGRVSDGIYKDGKLISENKYFKQRD
jgi:hypothetical protein